MILRGHHLRRQPPVFRALTGLAVADFDALAAALLPRHAAAARARLGRAGRRRASGGGHPCALPPRDQLLVAVVRLRRDPPYAVLGDRFGVSEPTARRTVGRLVRLLAAAGLDTMRLPDPGKGRRRDLDALLRETPALAVLVDTCAQRVQRPRDRRAADSDYGGKKQQHTLKSQLAVDERDGCIVDVAPSVRGPTAASTPLKGAGLLARLPAGVGALGDLAYVGIAEAHPAGLGATPRRTPRGKPRPEADSAYKRAFARRRVVVGHTIGRLRRYEALTQPDRHHRRGHTARVRAAAGLVNRQLRRHRAA